MDLCPYCNFKFTEGMNKDEHILKCQNINNIKNKEFETTPSLHSLYKMVLELQKDNKNNVLPLDNLSGIFLEKFNREYFDFNKICNELGISIKNN